MKVLGLDIGDRRVGVAIGDTETKIASPLVTLANNRSLMNELKKLMLENDVQTLVVGLPITLAGHTGIQAQAVMKMVEKIKAKLECEIALQDERLSSQEAENRLKGRVHTKGDIDAISASIILSTWLSSIGKKPY